MNGRPAAPRVALVSSSFAPHVGGVEQVTRMLALERQRAGAGTVVVTNRYPTALPPAEDIDGVEVHRLRFRFPEPRPRHLLGWLVGTRAARRELAAIIAGHRSEIVHVQCVSTNGYYALRAARRLRVPLVVSLHGELTMDASGIYERSALMRRTWRALLDEAAVVTACSQQVLDEAVAAYGPELRVRSRVVPNGVDAAAVRSAGPAARGRPYLLAVGRLVPQKGFDLLLDAFADLAEQHPDLDLVIAGDGPDRVALESRARPLGDRVRLPGTLPPTGVYSLMRSAAAFVLPSRHEPQGIVVLEAMAAGAPVVVTRVGGVPETVVDGVNGLIVEPGSAATLRDGIARVLADPALARARAQRAGDDVESASWVRAAERYAECYADALGSSTVRPSGL